MNSRNDQRGPRMARLKAVQAQLARSAALVQQQAADARRQEALDLRLSAEETLAGALLPPEQGLTRSTLFDRLRSVAVARAHALESSHAAGELETRAAELQTVAAGHQATAQAHQRKQRKLEHWHARRSEESRRSRERRRHLQELEEFPCHCRSPR